MSIHRIQAGLLTFESSYRQRLPDAWQRSVAQWLLSSSNTAAGPSPILTGFPLVGPLLRGRLFDGSYKPHFPLSCQQQIFDRSMPLVRSSWLMVWNTAPVPENAVAVSGKWGMGIAASGDENGPDITADCRLPTAHCRLLTAHCPLFSRYKSHHPLFFWLLPS